MCLFIHQGDQLSPAAAIWVSSSFASLYEAVAIGKSAN
jgi:hypothetical protein